MNEAHGNRTTTLSSSPLRALCPLRLCERNYKQSAPQAPANGLLFPQSPALKVVDPVIAHYFKACALINPAGGNICFVDKE